MTFMKRIIYIAALLLPLISGCSKPDPSQTPEQYGKYIFFSHSVDTKASLIESAEAMGQFGVIGFKYDESEGWNTNNMSDLPPNVFLDNSGNELFTQTLTCYADGTASYSPLQGWSNTKKYSFFAYYPIGNENIKLINRYGKDYTGSNAKSTPFIKYTWNGADLNNTTMVDLMIASAKNLYWKSDADTNLEGSDVKLSFKHCLSCIGLNFKNSASSNIQITSIELSLSDIVHSEATISLDGSNTSYGGEQDATATYTYSMDLPEGGVSVSSTETDGVEISDKLIMIPQSPAVTIKIKVGYSRSAEGYDKNDDYFESESLSTSLLEGTKHLIYLNFTDSTVEVKKLTSGAWVDIPEVEDTFN